jgi:hypothetical protein
MKKATLDTTLEGKGEFSSHVWAALRGRPSLPEDFTAPNGVAPEGLARNLLAHRRYFRKPKFAGRRT